MSTPNRTAVLNKLHKTLKKHFQPVKPATERTVLETVLYACCLENTPYEKADDAYARLQELYTDWNEVRVTSVTELAEMLEGVPDSRASAGRVKRALQSVFEAQYSFDMESLRKQNIGKSAKQLEKFGLTPFGISYVTQTAFGGHAIPIDEGAMRVLFALAAVTEQEAAKGVAPGMERAIPKSKGVEFGSLLHHLGAEMATSPFGAKVRSIILEVDPNAKDRLPKRTTKKAEAPPRPPEPAPPKKKTPAPSKSAKPPAAPPAKVKKKPDTKGLARKKPR